MTKTAFPMPYYIMDNVIPYAMKYGIPERLNNDLGCVMIWDSSRAIINRLDEFLLISGEYNIDPNDETPDKVTKAMEEYLREFLHINTHDLSVTSRMNTGSIWTYAVDFGDTTLYRLPFCIRIRYGVIVEKPEPPRYSFDLSLAKDWVVEYFNRVMNPEGMFRSAENVRIEESDVIPGEFLIEADVRIHYATIRAMLGVEALGEPVKALCTVKLQPAPKHGAEVSLALKGITIYKTIANISDLNWLSLED